MVLHPQHKLSYFNKAAQWEDDWIKTAEQLVREEFERSYLSVDVDSDLGCGEDVLESNGDIWMNDNIFDNLPVLTAPKPINLSSELDLYLSTDAEHATNPIAWWHERQKLFPRLSRMAIDYLTIPATPVDVERLFSRGRLILSHIRNCLSAQSTRARRLRELVDLPGLGDEELANLEEKGTKGRYVSVERLVELEDGKVEWQMVTSSTPGGSIPSFIAESSMAGQISVDVPHFLKWFHAVHNQGT
ncbi:hypothetical protein AZE42_07093 [Rhizopogon vesiculosus]|uniref:HAT C-terminal dimerisation domain-containing protein n=1 Tax=Rhizopogon vesiculosus TaxID=180088 RepID=A0A1J8QAD3_9AGAM|nr:hypothetical protein AZE42_07093 [Rhizopogon vesiculosus]